MLFLFSTLLLNNFANDLVEISLLFGLLGTEYLMSGSEDRVSLGVVGDCFKYRILYLSHRSLPPNPNGSCTTITHCRLPRRKHLITFVKVGKMCAH